jgi:mono/diheme cytochrome c family protein
MKILRAMLIMVVFISLCFFAIVTEDSSGGDSSEALFQENCASCHAKGGNIIKPDQPLKGSPGMKRFEVFLPWIRNPKPPMPPFPPSTISDQQAKELYDYILRESESTWK